MHHTHAIEVAKLGSNITITKDSKIHHTHAKEIVTIAASKGTNVTIYKEYHHTVMVELATIGGSNLTIGV